MLYIVETIFEIALLTAVASTFLVLTIEVIRSWMKKKTVFD